jgi:hypothetical protein
MLDISFLDHFAPVGMAATTLSMSFTSYFTYVTHYTITTIFIYWPMAFIIPHICFHFAARAEGEGLTSPAPLSQLFWTRYHFSAPHQMSHSLRVVAAYIFNAFRRDYSQHLYTFPLVRAKSYRSSHFGSRSEPKIRRCHTIYATPRAASFISFNDAHVNAARRFALRRRFTLASLPLIIFTHTVSAHCCAHHQPDHESAAHTTYMPLSTAPMQ